MKTSETSSPGQFYDGLAERYDAMVHFSARLVNAQVFVKALRERFPFETAVDIGCGTGAYVVALAREGVEAHGVDLSKDMVAVAGRNALDSGTRVHFHVSSMADLPLSETSTDLILCLGNTLAHIVEPVEFATVCAEFARVLPIGGHAVVQVLNYAKILALRERIVSIDRDAEHHFVRFYDFLPDGNLQFNILEYDCGEQTVAESATVSSVLLHPYLRDELQAGFAETGLCVVDVCGDLKLTSFEESESDSLFLVLRKAGG